MPSDDICRVVMYVTAAQLWRDLRKYFPKAMVLKLQCLEFLSKYAKMQIPSPPSRPPKGGAQEYEV